jgi:hypothetical protein
VSAKVVKLEMPPEFDRIRNVVMAVFDEAWTEWLKERDDRFNLHIYHGDGDETCVQFNSFDDDFIFCASLEDVIKSAIDCNDGKEDLLAIASDLRKAADTLIEAAK